MGNGAFTKGQHNCQYVCFFKNKRLYLHSKCQLMTEMKINSKPKGLAARILGEQPTGLQKTFFWLMILSLTLWPLFFFASVFFFDAPIRSTVDEICRWGMVLTIWLYPIYLLPLLGLWFRLSKRLRTTWLFYLCPLIPVIIFFSLVELASSEYAARKPKGYDPATFIRLNESFAKDINHSTA